MAKKYYQSVKDRRDESRGMKKAMRGSDKAEARMLVKGYESMYETMKSNERMDGDMLHEDSREPANMPQDCMIKMYPPVHFGYEAELIDTYQGMDFQVQQDVRDQKKGKYPKKY